MAPGVDMANNEFLLISRKLLSTVPHGSVSGDLMKQVGRKKSADNHHGLAPGPPNFTQESRLLQNRSDVCQFFIELSSF